MKEAAKSYYFRRGSSIGICGAPLITIGLPSEEALLLSVSRNRKNFSASIGVTSLVNVSPFLSKWIACNSTRAPQLVSQIGINGH
jgi:hypothetical protein